MDHLQLCFSRSSSMSSSSSSPPNAHSLSICMEAWMMAEQRIGEILSTIQPTPFSEIKRKQVIEHLQRIIKGRYGTEVFNFGSVPLGTYIPDGDIDLTVLCYGDMEDTLAREICKFLENRRSADFPMRDILYINAQVKIVKFSVENIAVDITFNQISGLSTLCFLEQVDQLVGKDHLFKRSVILIKAWCFYESRILGAYYGLISAYGLETMVLHIINLFHSSLNGPLAVLHKFLDYYSTFDFDNYCITAYGAIAVSSFQKVTEEILENDGIDLLLSKEFFRNCKAIFSSPRSLLREGAQGFPVKHLNIMDPLKDNNNLGRSVNKANFFRIRCALAVGAQNLSKILMLPGERLVEGIENFFKNTLDRNGRGIRPDVRVPVPAFGTGKIYVADLAGDFPSYYSNLLSGQWHFEYNLIADELNPLALPQVEISGTWDAQYGSKGCSRTSFSRKGTDVYIPRPFFSHTCDSGSGVPATLSDNEENRRRVPHPPNCAMGHNFNRRTQEWTMVPSPYATVFGLEVRATGFENQYEVPMIFGFENIPSIVATEMENQDERDEAKPGKHFDLSLEAFPCLQHRERASICGFSILGQPEETNLDTIQLATYQVSKLDCSDPCQGGSSAGASNMEI